MGPAALPKEIVATLYGELARGLKDPEVAQRLRNLGLHALATPPEDSARIFARDRAIWAKIVRDNNIKAE